MQVSHSREGSVPPSQSLVPASTQATEVRIAKKFIVLQRIERKFNLLLVFQPYEKEERFPTLTPSEEYQLLIKR